MASINRTATGTWRGDLPHGEGQMRSASGVLQELPFTYATRFEDAEGTNPEELIAAAHAGCYSMALANHLATEGHPAEEIRTEATVTLEDGTINHMRLVAQGRVPGLEQAEFQRLAGEAERKCPVSNLLRGGLSIDLEARLI